jgi:hypothetical protein
MSSITIHSIDPELNRRLSSMAKEEGKSKNQLIKEVLARSTGLPVRSKYGDEYREFCGLWSQEEFKEFSESQNSNSQIDQGDWR